MIRAGSAKSGKWNFMRPIEEYRNQAIECALLAQTLSDLHDKALWLFMAEAWLWFADDTAKFRGSADSPEEVVELPKL